MAIDVRVRYTKMIIKQSFIEQLKKKHVSKITVKEICDMGQINRSTFYKHYEDVYDLLEEIETEQMEEFQDLIEKTKTLGTKRTVIEMLEKIKRDNDLYLLLFSENNDNNLARKYVEKCYYIMASAAARVFSGIPTEKQNMFLNFISWGCAGIVRCWMENGMMESTEQVADLIEKLTITTINAASEKQ